MSDKELKELVASLAIAQKEMTEKMAVSRTEVDKQIKQAQKQLGELGNKWGTFTEGMAIASIKKILRDKFNIPIISRNDRNVELIA